MLESSTMMSAVAGDRIATRKKVRKAPRRTVEVETERAGGGSGGERWIFVALHRAAGQGSTFRAADPTQ
jgi:hypothetical protein